MRHRSKEALIGISLAMIIALGLFYFLDEKPGITGYAINENYFLYDFHASQVKASGILIHAIVDDINYYYFYEDGVWTETKDFQEYEVRLDMKDSLWSGLVYLQSYNAKIYYQGERVTNIGDLAAKI